MITGLTGDTMLANDNRFYKWYQVQLAMVLYLRMITGTVKTGRVKGTVKTGRVKQIISIDFLFTDLFITF